MVEIKKRHFEPLARVTLNDAEIKHRLGEVVPPTDNGNLRNLITKEDPLKMLLVHAYGLELFEQNLDHRDSTRCLQKKIHKICSQKRCWFDGDFHPMKNPIRKESPEKRIQVNVIVQCSSKKSVLHQLGVSFF